MNNKDYDFRNETGTWQTGRIQPPKRYGGLIAFLLVLVILLSGISTALSIMNIKLHRKLSDSQATTSMAFSRSAESAEAQPTEAVHEEVRELQTHLGITGTVIPDVYLRYYQLPRGIYVSRIADRSEAQEKGMVEGDIITSINGQSVRDSLPEDWADGLKSGDKVALSLYRSGTQIDLELTWNPKN